MYHDEYEYTKNELLKRKTYPYFFHAETQAIEFFEIFKSEVPTASYYAADEIGQAICYDDRARKRLFEHTEKLKETLEPKHKAAMDQLRDICSAIQRDSGIEPTKDNKSDELLLAELDDVVQRLAHCSNEEWARLRNKDTIEFERIKHEIYRRLSANITNEEKDPDF